MSRTDDERDRVEVSRLLAGAMKAITNVRYCWLATDATGGGSNAMRPMGRLPPEPGDKE
jgi:hypothetical protein